MSALEPARRLHRLIYVSRQRVEAPSLEAVVSEILRASIRNNRADALTGLLLVHDGHFIQILEGAAWAVSAAYQRILADERHERVRLLIETEVDRREFANWDMCARSLDEADAAILEELSPEQIEPDALDGETALALLKAVRGSKAGAPLLAATAS